MIFNRAMFDCYWCPFSIYLCTVLQLLWDAQLHCMYIQLHVSYKFIQPFEYYIAIAIASYHTNYIASQPCIRITNCRMCDWLCLSNIQQAVHIRSQQLQPDNQEIYVYTIAIYVCVAAKANVELLSLSTQIRVWITSTRCRDLSAGAKI